MITEYLYRWKPFIILPLFNLPVVQKMPDTLCQKCPLAYYEHPLAPTDGENSYWKLCTLFLLKNGFLSLEEVLATGAGCGYVEDLKEITGFLSTHHIMFKTKNKNIKKAMGQG